MLTAARMETETVLLLEQHAGLAEAMPGNEPVGW